MPISYSNSLGPQPKKDDPTQPVNPFQKPVVPKPVTPTLPKPPQTTVTPPIQTAAPKTTPVQPTAAAPTKTPMPWNPFANTQKTQAAPAPAATATPATYTVKSGENLTAGQGIPGTAPVTEQGKAYSDALMGKLQSPDKNSNEFGDIYDTKLLEQLKNGTIPGMGGLRSMNARNSGLDIASSEQSARDAAIRAGLNPNDPGFARAVAEARSNALTRMLTRDTEADAKQIAGYSNALGLARDREQRGYDRTESALTDARNFETDGYNKTQNEFTQKEAARKEKLDREDKLIAAITDPRLQQAARGVQASGGNVSDFITTATGTAPVNGQISSAKAGTVDSAWASSSPAKVEFDGLVDTVRQSTPKLPGESDAAFEARVLARAQELATKVLDSTVAPLDTQKDDRTAVGIEQRLATLPKGQMLDGKEFETARKLGVIKQFTPASIPTGTKNVKAFLLDNPSGIISLEGEQYKVVSGSSPTTSFTSGVMGLGQKPRHTDVVAVLDSKGNQKYIWGGKIQNKPPKDVGGKDHWTPFGF